jgi:hypothetical protein
MSAETDPRTVFNFLSSFVRMPFYLRFIHVPVGSNVSVSLLEMWE